MSESQPRDYWVGFDLGGTKMLAAVYDSEFKRVARQKKNTKGHKGAESGVERIIDLIQDALDEAKITADQLGGIGAGCPGPLDLDEGIMLETPNLGWQNVPLRKHLEEKFKCPAVIANDVDVGVYGEFRFGAAKDSRCVIGIFPGTGIGGGCVYEGSILRGAKSSCMEIGHVQVMADGPLCGCGNRGCLEAVASRLSIASAAAKAAYRGDAPYLMDKYGSDISDIRSGALAAAVENGDTVIKDLVLNAASHIGVAAAGVVHLLAPDMIILGGGLVEAMPDLIVKKVQSSANERVMPAYRKTFKVAAAQLDDDAAIVGAAAWAKKQFS